MSPTDLVDRVRELQESSDCRFVGRDEFCRLLVSSKKLVRADQQRDGIRGLRDVQSNRRFLIEENELFGSVTPWS